MDAMVDRQGGCVNICCMSIPDTMTAIDPASPGGPEVLQPVQRPVPTPGPDEVLVRVAAAGVNRPDVLQRLGLYPMPPGTPTIPGLEIAGTVVAVGEAVSRWRVGEAVCALVAGGGYAEYCTAPAGQCLPVPAGMAMADAAGLPETWFTVWSNVVDRGRAKAGETMLVHGGTSGIGVTAIQLAQVLGLRIIVTAGSSEKCAAALALGADAAIDYKAQDFVADVQRLTNGHGIDLVLDMVGGDYVARNLKCLAEDGRHVSIAFQRGMTGEIDLATVMRKRLLLTGSMLRPRPISFKTAIAETLEGAVWPEFESGRLKPVTDRVFPLAEAADAHRRMEAGLHVGKIVLAVPA
jgi:putative PIG3 family NAD(P)H quinone oxidoreductase